MAEHTNYDDFSNEDLVVRSRAGIAVYVNQNDDIVIRQDGGYDDDAIVVVHREDIEALILALQNVGH